MRCMSRRPTRRSAIGPSPAAESYLKADAILDAARKTGAEAIHPGLRISHRRMRTLPRRAKRAGIVFIGPDAGADAGLRPEAHERANLRCKPRCRWLPGSALLRDIDARDARGGAHRLSGDAQEHGRRRRHRHAARVERSATSRRCIERVERLAPQQFQGRRHLHREICRARRGTSRCRSSATARATSSRSASATAPRSGATRKSIEETPAPNLPEATRAALWETARRLGADR